jgi:hypothetical protein
MGYWLITSKTANRMQPAAGMHTGQCVINPAFSVRTISQAVISQEIPSSYLTLVTGASRCIIGALQAGGSEKTNRTHVSKTSNL